MSVVIYCDKCKTEIIADFVRVQTSFFTRDDTDIITYCANGDEVILCDNCYNEFLRTVEDE